MTDKEEMKNRLEESKVMQEKARKHVQDNNRILALMKAGLTERPLDRDFYERIEAEFKRESDTYEEGCRLIKFLEKVVLNEADE